MARVATRIYVPLDVNFFDDDKILQAGEAAGWLYLNMCARAKQLDNDGVMTREQIARCGVKGWQRRLARLIEVGAIEQAGEGIYGVVGWLKWNESKAERGDRLAAERARKSKQKGTT